MKEFLLNKSAKNRILVPGNTGPGPSTLVDDLIYGLYKDENNVNYSKGYFGEVSSGELIDGPDLAALLNITTGTRQNNTEPWLKFILDGRILFVAKKTLRYSISWNDLNSKNAINGSKVITHKGNRYKVRVLRGLGPDTSKYTNRSYDDPSTHNSEWNRLIYNVAAVPVVNVSPGSIHGRNWEMFSNVELGFTSFGSQSWCMENDPTVTTNKVRRAGGGNMYAYVSTYNDTNVGWRPVLELVP